MKKHNNTVILFMILILMVIILTSCGNSGSDSLDKDEIQADGANQSDISQSEQNAEANGNNPSSAEDSQADEPSAFASVIVKSDNTVTDVEKQEVLNELKSEIDALVNSLNQLDEATESDLDY